MLDHIVVVSILKLRSTPQSQAWHGFNLALFIQWVNDGCLTSNEQFVSYFMADVCDIQWNDDAVRFVLDQHV